jgi:superfamily II DNA or RNA helicase
MGEGIDIKNLWNIFLVNTAKSERIIRQICGRGLRMFPGKDKTLIFDFVDDLRFSPKEAYSTYYKENYMWKHYKDREKIYKGQNFPMFKKNVKFN